MRLAVSIPSLSQQTECKANPLSEVAGITQQSKIASAEPDRLLFLHARQLTPSLTLPASLYDSTLAASAVTKPLANRTT